MLERVARSMPVKPLYPGPLPPGAAEVLQTQSKLLFLRGRALKELGKYAEAEAALRFSVEVNPANAASRAVLGAVLANLGRHEDAVRQFVEALKGMEAMGLLNGTEQVHYQLSMSLKALGRSEEAAGHLRLYRELQEAIAGLSRLERLAANRPESSAAFLDLARAQVKAGLLAQAASSFERAAQNDGGDPAALAGLAICRVHQDRVQEAEALAARSLARQENAWGFHALALIRAARREIPAARQAAARASALVQVDDPFQDEIRKLADELDRLSSR
jgi:tetratricopeptide (TPR) repeat protein